MHHNQRGRGRGGGNGHHQGGGHGPRPGDGHGPSNVGGGVYPIIVNVFPIRQLPTKVHYQYDVSIVSARPTKGNESEDKMPKMRKLDIVDRLQFQNPNIFNPRAAFDGEKNMWLARRLPLGPGGGADSASFQVNMSNNNPPVNNRGVYTVHIRFAATINPDHVNQLVTRAQAPSPEALTAIMLLQQLIRSAPNQQHPASNARSVFPEGNTRGIGGGLFAWRGFFQSVKPTIGRALVNVDSTTSAAYTPGPLYDVALDVIGGRNLADFSRMLNNRQTWNRLRSFYKGVQITVRRGDQVSPKAYKIRDLVFEAGEVRFTNRDGHDVTVRQYYLDTYGTNLRHPQLWGVSLGRGVVIPGELCQVVPNQLYKKKVADNLMKGMLEFAEQSPSAKIAAIRGAVTGPALDWANSVSLQAAGMSISTAPLEVSARHLSLPNVYYHNDQPASIHGQDGSWNVLGKRFVRPGSIRSWAVIDYARHRGTVENFLRKLQENLTNLGLRIAAPAYVCDGNGQSVEEDVKRIIRTMDGPPDLLIAVLPFPAPDIRRAIKHTVFTLHLIHPGKADLGPREVPIATQCVTQKKIQADRGLDQYCNNLALKINVKLGGVNGVVRDEALEMAKMTPTMFLGADVTHPGPGVHNRPSVSSLVWSTDREFASYNTASDVQEPRTEIIAGLKGMMERALLDFASKNKSIMPETLIMYRDGVSEGEYERVKSEECAAIREAIRSVWAKAPEGRAPPPVPRLVFIVVGKRHHIRMFPKHDPRGNGNARVKGGGNCPPGILVDEDLRSPYAQDFYLLSHGGLKGTSVPGHYIVLENEPEIPLNIIQQFSYALCYSYHRATRAVSIPAPVYYADLVCGHAEFQFDNYLHFADDASTANTDNFNLDTWRSGFRRVNATLRERFYFL